MSSQKEEKDLKNIIHEKLEEAINYKKEQTYEEIYKNIMDKYPKTPIQYAQAIAISLSEPETQGHCIWDGNVGIPP